jgi:hypothetical protein
MSDFYVVLNSRQSLTFYGDNQAHSFKVRLNQPLRFKEKGWKVSLVQYKSPVRDDVLVCSNVCSYSIVGEEQHRVLRLMSTPPSGRDFSHAYYVPVALDFIDTVHIYLVSAANKGREQSSQGATHVTLHFAYMP